MVPEHLRLGTWELVEGWTRRDGRCVEPRIALQLIHEAALCRRGVRRSRSLSQKGFEVANGLPFVVTDQAVHSLLSAHTVAEAEALQVALGRIRRASGHYEGRLLAIDPHHMRSYSKRQTRRHRHKPNTKAVKTSQTFFCLDVDTNQPVAFTVGSSSRTVAQSSPGLLALAASILHPLDGHCRVLADLEHFCAQLFEYAISESAFDLLVPIPGSIAQRRRMQSIGPDQFTPKWAGMATARRPYRFRESAIGPLYHIVQRCGERPDRYRFKGFLSTSACDEVEALTLEYPKRWHVEEFFNANQALGWQRAGTLNLNIRYGQMSMALIAQSAIHQIRQRLGPPFSHWDALHFANNLFMGLDGDIRVRDDTIVVTFYNAPNTDRLRHHYEHLPALLEQEGVDPRIPWLYDFKLDFRFR